MTTASPARRDGLFGVLLPPAGFGSAGGEPGDPGLFGPGSTVWRIGRERALLAAGPSALLLQVAHPLVAAGVVEHSGFEEDPFERLWATLDAVLTVSFGDSRQARAAAARVWRRHLPVRGGLASPIGEYARGTSYSASDPDLALWVHATLVWTAFAAYTRFVGPLDADDRRRYYEEMKTFAVLFGVPPRLIPPDYAAFGEYFRDMERGRLLAVGGEARRLAAHILNPPLPRALVPAAALMRILTAGLLPPRFRREFGLTWQRRHSTAFELVSRSSRAALPFVPAILRYWPHYGNARRRLGVEYKSRLNYG